MMPILLGVLLLAGLYVYTQYFMKPASATLTESDNSATLSGDILITIQKLHTITLDNSLFSDPAFQSLSDFGVTIPPEAVGRRNPFLPIGGIGASGAGTSAGGVQIQLPKAK
jgi:hypothetical protein